MADLLGEVNCSIRALAESIDPYDSSAWQFLCECGEQGCDERVRVTLARYDALKDADGAVIAPGHQLQRLR